MDTTATNNSTLPLLQQQEEGIDIFDYGQGQFQSLRAVDLAISSISLASSTLVIFAYLYMFIYHRKQANRVSLRCAFLCCIADVVNDIINILLTDVIGDSDFCRASGVIIDFANIFNSALLTLVGLNLFLIFVVNVNRKDLLERFYYPGAIIYSIVGIVVLIYFQTTYNTTTLYSHTNCWYLTYIVDRTSNTISWVSHNYTNSIVHIQTSNIPLFFTLDVVLFIHLFCEYYCHHLLSLRHDQTLARTKLIEQTIKQYCCYIKP